MKILQEAKANLYCETLNQEQYSTNIVEVNRK